MQYRFGTFTTTATPTAQTITLGFVPSSFKLTNYTGFGTTAKVTEAQWYYGMPAASALIKTTATDSDVTGIYQVPSILASNGFTPFSTGANWPVTTIAVSSISKANPGVVTIANGSTLVQGDTITFSSVGGMTQINEQRALVGVLTVAGTTTFPIYDLFGNPFDTSGFSTYTSGGQINIISTPGAGAVVAFNGLVTTPGGVKGLQYDTGSAGIIIGTSLFTSDAYVYYWEAFYQTPTGW